MSIEQVELREARSLRDAQAMRAIRNACREYMTNNTSEISSFEQFKWWLQVRWNKDWKLYLLWHNGDPVGYGILRKKDCKWWVTGGLVEHSRGIGLGRDLFTLLTKTAMESPSASVYLEVRLTNTKALNLYRSIGFRFIGTKNEETVIMGNFQR